MWILSNIKLNPDTPGNWYTYKNYRLFLSSTDGKPESQNPRWLVVGYVLPRQNESSDFNNLPVNKILEMAYQKFGEDFIYHIKGNFVILRLESDYFRIYSDRFAINKYFIWQSGNSFILSDSLKAITRSIAVKPFIEGMAVYALTYHFIGGITMFWDIQHNLPGQIIESYESKLIQSFYWKAEELTYSKNNDVSPIDIINQLKSVMNRHINIRDNNKISLSLTAGADSRILFSLLLNQDKPLHTYTYGNPNSIDCVTAQQIAGITGVEHDIHDILFNSITFKKYGKRSVLIGESLTSLHRTHRLAAIEQEAQYAETMVLGTMGGEFVKGANRDDYIISDFVFEFSQNQTKETLIKFLRNKGFRQDKVDIEYLMDFFRKQNWCKQPKLVDLYSLVEISASLHHAQNNIQYRQYINHVVTPFLDIDYLELLFQSDYHFLIKNNLPTNFYRRLDNHRFSSEIQTLLNHELSAIPYNSGFIPREYQANKLFAAIKARLRKRKWNYPANFPLGKWMNAFAIEELQRIKTENTIVSEAFDLEDLISTLTEKNKGTGESFWVTYTSPIQLQYVWENFNGIW